MMLLFTFSSLLKASSAIHEESLIRTVMLKKALQRHSRPYAKADCGVRPLDAKQYQITWLQSQNVGRPELLPQPNLRLRILRRQS